jgi:hypothetical protein
MGGGSNRAVIDAWVSAQQTHDWDAGRRLYAPDVVLSWPQTGERILGIDNVVAVDLAYPGGLPEVEPHRVVGSEDRWVLDATFVPRRIIGSGDVWVCEATLTYPSGDRWEYAGVLELHEGRIVRQTEYFAPVSEPPEWRAHLVERTR